MNFASMMEWEITASCNMECVHCMAKRDRVRGSDLTLQQQLSLAEKIAAAGIKMVALSGGEPLCHEGWDILASTLNARGIQVTLVTNGLLLNHVVAQKIKDSGIREVFLSLDGLKQTHDQIRKTPGAFDGVTAAVGHLETVCVPYSFLTTVIRQNLEELPLLAHWVAGTNCNIWQVWAGIPADDQPLWLTRTDSKRLYTMLRDLKKRCPTLFVGDSVGHFKGRDQLVATTGGAGGHSFCCGAGDQLLSIRNDGRTRGCLALGEHWNGINMNDNCAQPIWEQALALRAQRQAEVDAFCTGCKHYFDCTGRCPATILSGEEPGCLSYFPVSYLPHRGEGRKNVLGFAKALGALAVTTTLGCTGGCGTGQQSISQDSSETAIEMRDLDKSSDKSTASAEDTAEKEAPSDEGSANNEQSSQTAEAKLSEPASVLDGSKPSTDRDALKEEKTLDANKIFHRRDNCMMSHVGCRDFPIIQGTGRGSDKVEPPTQSEKVEPSAESKAATPKKKGEQNRRSNRSNSNRR